MTWTYNRLKGEARAWARKNHMPIGEYCIPVKGGRKMGKSAIDEIAGNGVHGFSTRRRKTDGEEVGLVKGLDGQWKSGRGSIARKRKNTCLLATHSQIKAMQMDGDDKLEAFIKEAIIHQDRLVKEKAIRREIRKINRNPKARRGHKRRRAA